MIIFKDLITGFYYFFQFIIIFIIFDNKKLLRMKSNFELTVIWKGDEVFTDSSKVKLVDGCLWEVECRASDPLFMSMILIKIELIFKNQKWINFKN